MDSAQSEEIVRSERERLASSIDMLASVRRLSGLFEDIISGVEGITEIYTDEELQKKTGFTEEELEELRVQLDSFERRMEHNVEYNRKCVRELERVLSV